MAIDNVTLERISNLCKIDKELSRFQDIIWEVLEGYTKGMSDNEIDDLMRNIEKGENK